MTNYACKQEGNLTKDSEAEGPEQTKWSLPCFVYFRYIDFFSSYMKLKKINIPNSCIVCNAYLCIDLVSKFAFQEVDLQL